MNKTQRKIGWWILILLSATSAFYGLWIYQDNWNNLWLEEITLILIFTFVIPIILIGGYGFIIAGQKKDNKNSEGGKNGRI